MHKFRDFCPTCKNLPPSNSICLLPALLPSSIRVRFTVERTSKRQTSFFVTLLDASRETFTLHNDSVHNSWHYTSHVNSPYIEIWNSRARQISEHGVNSFTAYSVTPKALFAHITNESLIWRCITKYECRLGSINCINRTDDVFQVKIVILLIRTEHEEKVLTQKRLYQRIYVDLWLLLHKTDVSTCTSVINTKMPEYRLTCCRSARVDWHRFRIIQGHKIQGHGRFARDTIFSQGTKKRCNVHTRCTEARTSRKRKGGRTTRIQAALFVLRSNTVNRTRRWDMNTATGRDDASPKPLDDINVYFTLVTHSRWTKERNTWDIRENTRCTIHDPRWTSARGRLTSGSRKPAQPHALRHPYSRVSVLPVPYLLHRPAFSINTDHRLPVTRIL